MNITLDSIAIGSGLSAAVPPLSLTVDPGAPVVLAVETDERPMLVSMLLGGRLRADSGTMVVDDEALDSFVGAADLLRDRVALIDTPFVVEAEPDATLGLVVAEELSFAGRPSGGGAVRAFLASFAGPGTAASDYAKVAMRVVPTALRIRISCELALLRPGIEALVVTSPERHGGDPVEWFGELTSITDRGVAVIVITDAATERLLLSLGARSAIIPLES